MPRSCPSLKASCSPKTPDGVKGGESNALGWLLRTTLAALVLAACALAGGTQLRHPQLCPQAVGLADLQPPRGLVVHDFLHIHVEQNGKSVMEAHTAEMINGLRDLIRFLSSVTTLKPGTLLTTGTPAGVSKLADGDRLKGTIDGIGTMELKVAAER